MNADCDFVKALEGKDVKDLLTNIGSGAGAAAPAAGGAVATEAAPAEEKKEEKKEEGMLRNTDAISRGVRERCLTILRSHRGGVRRGHGFRSLRLSGFLRFFPPFCTPTPKDAPLRRWQAMVLRLSGWDAISSVYRVAMHFQCDMPL